MTFGCLCRDIRFLIIVAIMLWLVHVPLQPIVGQTAAAADDDTATAPIEAQVPEVWKKPPSGPLSIDEGALWYRAVVVPPQDWDAADVSLFVEAVDDARQIFVNGHRIGLLGTFPPEYRSGLGQSHRLSIPDGLLRAGEPNVVAIRVYRYHGRQGFNVAAPVLFGPGRAIRLSGRWQAIPDDDQALARLSARFDVPEEQWFDDTIASDEAERDLKRLDDDAGPLSPAQAHQRLRTADDLEVDLVLADPVIGQPLSMKWDHRGRLWLVEYLQYPDPAGLTAVSRDQFLRTVWDQTPEAPPNHFPGADRISVHEDTSGDGVYDQHHVFVDGLSLVTSIALDRDGVWVLNPPHLLFYPDRDGDAVADGDPEVHLEGFGLEDAHSLANSLRFGPDGWLYGVQGSTVSAEVRRPGSSEEPIRSVGQLVWRYHPASGKYEIFAEGGGNAFGLEIDAAGRFFSGHNGGNTRGFHYVPGGYFRKGFGKHGELSNPYTFGYFEAMPHHQVERFTHTFVIQQSDVLPPRVRGHLFGVEPLQGRVVMSQMEPHGASFKTEDVEHVLLSDGDTWFRPVDIQEGPDGALYIADFYEQRIDHASHYQGRIHRESGRIYRLRGKQHELEVSLPEADDLDGWIDSLAAPIRWQRQTALRRIVALADHQTPEKLRGLLATDPGDAAGDQHAPLGALWALHQLGQLEPAQARRLLDHPNAALRLWTIRLMAQSGGLSGPLLVDLVELAASEPDAEVRVELAAAARRLPASSALALIDALLANGAAEDDKRLPLMLWWAVEAKVSEQVDVVVAWWVNHANIWQQRIARDELAQRLMRRLAASGVRRDLIRCARLLRAAPDRQASDLLLAGFETAYRGRAMAALPAELIEAMAQVGGGSLALRVRRGDADAVAQALAVAIDQDQQPDERIEHIEMLADARPPEALEALLSLAVDGVPAKPVRVAALAALHGYDSPQIAADVLSSLADSPPPVRDTGLTLIASRPQWTRQLVDAVADRQWPADQVPDTVVRKMLLHRDESLRQAVRDQWGEVSGATTEQMEADIERYRDVLAAAIGNPRVGKALFAKHCGSCHQLFGEGGQSGPDLTSYQRQDVRGMITHIVNPSLEIREGYENYLVLTDDGRAINGLMADSDRQVVVIRDAEGRSHTIARDEIIELAGVPQSLMPEGLLSELSDQQIRDLFAYLRSPQPIP